MDVFSSTKLLKAALVSMVLISAIPISGCATVGVGPVQAQTPRQKLLDLENIYSTLVIRATAYLNKGVLTQDQITILNGLFHLADKMLEDAHNALTSGNEADLQIKMIVLDAALKQAVQVLSDHSEIKLGEI